MVKHRNIFLVYLFTIITLGIYGIYWTVSTKNEMNGLGAKIPTAWLIIIPFVNIYWMYKYCEGFSQVNKDDHKVLWFILSLFLGFVMPAIVQSSLNKLAEGSQPAQPATPVPATSATPAAAAPAATPAPAAQQPAVPELPKGNQMQ